MVGYIVMTATNTERLSGLMLPKKREEIVTSKLMVKAAEEELKELIKSGEGAQLATSMEETHNISFMYLRD